MGFEVEVVARRFDNPNAVVVLEESLLRHVHHCDRTAGIIHDAPAVHVGSHERCFAYFCEKMLFLFCALTLCDSQKWYHWK
jgi:hypothetical protein